MVLLVACQDTTDDSLVSAKGLIIIIIVLIPDQILMIEYIAGRDIVPALLDVEVCADRQVRNHNRILGRDTVDGSASPGGRADNRYRSLILRRIVYTCQRIVMDLASIIICLGDKIGPVRVRNQLPHLLPVFFCKGFQIHSELKHITEIIFRTLRQNVFNDVQILKVRMVLVIEVAAVSYPGIRSCRGTSRYLNDLIIDFNLFGLLVSIDFHFVNRIFNFFIGQHEYSGLAGFQREITVFIHRHLNRISPVVFAVSVVNTGADTFTALIRGVFIQRMNAVIICIVFKESLELILLVDKPGINTIRETLRELFFHNNFARTQDFQVELDIQVGRACATLHIKGLEFMVGVVRECIRCPIAIHIFPGYGIDLIFHALRCTAGVLYLHKDIIERLLSCKAGPSRIMDLTSGKIDGAAQGLMNAADIQHKDTINIDPHVIITGELKDHRISIIQSAVFKLGKISLHLHARKEVGSALCAVDIFISTAVTDRQFTNNFAIRILISVLIHQTGYVFGHIDIIKRHIMAVRIICMARLGIIGIRRSSLAVNGETGITVLSQIREVVLGAIAEHAALIVIALEEKICHAGL